MISGCLSTVTQRAEPERNDVDSQTAVIDSPIMSSARLPNHAFVISSVARVESLSIRRASIRGFHAPFTTNSHSPLAHAALAVYLSPVDQSSEANSPRSEAIT